LTMMAELGEFADHATVDRWAVRILPVLIAALRESLTAGPGVSRCFRMQAARRIMFSPGPAKPAYGPAPLKNRP
jgi:hypothetical protein